MSDCTISGNTANNGDGGGIYNGYAGSIFTAVTSGAVTLTGCTLSGNSAAGGGALLNRLYCNATLTDCTVSGNTATYVAGLVLVGATNVLDDCTVSGNTDTATVSGLAAGMSIGADGATLNDTIVAGNTDRFGASDLGGAKASGSNNLIGTLIQNGGILASVSGSHNQLGVTNPMLGPLAWNGGPTQTMALLTGSPAIGAGSIALIAGIVTDQRGAPRINGGTVDIGAFESGPTTIVVTSLADVNSPTIDLFAPNGITLREAIAFAGIDPSGADTIVFSPFLEGTIDLTLGALPTIRESLTIVGPGADVLTIDAQEQSGILSIGSGANVTISSLTLAHGLAMSPADNGGAIVNNGTLTLNECSLTGNTATNGGAIDNTGTLTLTNSTLSANKAYGNGGAIDNPGALSMTDCTVSGNLASVDGGGIYNVSYNSQPNNALALTGCTIYGNYAGGLGGGIFGRNLTLNDTIVAHSGSEAGDIWGIASGSNNLIDDADSAGGLSASDGNLLGVDPKLGPLAYNGGSTETMALLPGSPAIGAGALDGVSTDAARFRARLARSRHRRLPVPGATAECDDLRPVHGDRPGRGDLHPHRDRPHARGSERDVHLHHRLERRRQRRPDHPGAGIVTGSARLQHRQPVDRIHPERDRARPEQPEQRPRCPGSASRS